MFHLLPHKSARKVRFALVSLFLSSSFQIHILYVNSFTPSLELAILLILSFFSIGARYFRQCFSTTFKILLSFENPLSNKTIPILDHFLAMLNNSSTNLSFLEHGVTGKANKHILQLSMTVLLVMYLKIYYLPLGSGIFHPLLLMEYCPGFNFS